MSQVEPDLDNLINKTTFLSKDIYFGIKTQLLIFIGNTVSRSLE